MANLSTNLPVLNVPLVDANGNLTVPWLMFLVQLYQRTGADQTPALNLTQVQALAIINLIIAASNVRKSLHSYEKIYISCNR